VTQASDALRGEAQAATRSSDELRGEAQAVTQASDALRGEAQAVAQSRDELPGEAQAVTQASDALRGEAQAVTQSSDELREPGAAGLVMAPSKELRRSRPWSARGVPSGAVAVLGAALLLSSCSRCSSGTGGDASVASASRDAGFRLGAPKRSVDLRTAILYLYPEYRDTAVLETRGTLTRVIPGLTDAARDEALRQLRYTPAPDGGWALSSFHLTQLTPDSLSVSVRYDPEQLAHLYVSPTSLTTEELGLYLPRFLPAGAERFTFDVRYVSSPARSRELVRQAVRLLLGNQQWKATAPLAEWTDADPPADSERAELEGVSGAVIVFERTGGRVHAQYVLDTR
jgi:hypothetical protein